MMFDIQRLLVSNETFIAVGKRDENIKINN